ncbi:ATP-binding Cassette (ABC) Superfamily, partial [Thraustotheca clavata]
MTKATLVRQTLVLLWKNATLKRRDCRGLFVDFGLTLLILFLLYWLGINNIVYAGVENVPEARNLNLEQTVPTLQLLPLLLTRSNRLLGVVSPQANDFIAFLDTRYAIPHTPNATFPNFHTTTRIFASTSDMEEYAKDSMQSNTSLPLFAGIVFEKNTVTIRLSDEIEESNGKAINDGLEVTSDFGIFASLKNKTTTNLFPGFLPLQIALQEYNVYVTQGVGCSSLATDLNTFGLAWNDVKLSGIDSCNNLQGSNAASTSWLYSTLTSVIPYPVASHTEVADPITSQIIVCLVYIGLWPFSRFLRDTIIEKETKLKEYLYIIGVRESALVCSWVALYKLYALITTIVATLLFQDVLFSSGAFFFALFFFTFLVTVVCFGLIVVPFFNVSKTAMGISPFLYLAFCSPLLAQKLGLMHNVFWDILATLSSPTVFYNAFLAATGMGLDGKLKTIDFGTIQYAWLHLVALAIFYSLLGVYLDRILPKTIGVSAPWHYPFHMSYWRSNSCPGKYQNKSYQTFQTNDEESFVVKMSDVGKTYDDGKVAVQNLSLTIPSGEIFGLLGVNGAGKTTTLSMLSGMFAPTEGTLSVCGEEGMPSIRQHLGVCFQQDVLYENLTIEEHVLLLARLKGQHDDAAIKAECAAKCAAFGLSDKIHEFTRALSGGSKRKVCVILAFLGDAKLVLLDEPTTGIDLESQKSVWEAIRSESSDRAILLTTHSMQEAHVLSHRIGIMASGEMKCIGTSGQLRDTYGVGYKLRISKSKDDRQVSDLVRQSLKLVAGALVQREHKWGIDCQLPLGQEKTFPALLRSLDDLKLSSHISTYSISTTTLEDVFVKISTGDAVATAADEALVDSDSPLAAKKAAAIDTAAPVPSSYFGTFGVQVKAIIVKKALLLKRDIRSTASQFLWPIVFFCVISFLTVQIGHSSRDAIPTFSSPVGVAGNANLSSGNIVPIPLSGDSETGVVDYLLKHPASTVGTVFVTSSSHAIFYNASIPGALASTVNTLYCAANPCNFEIHTKTLEMAAFSKNLSGVVSDFFGIVIAYFALMGLIIATTPFATSIVKERE